MDFTKAATIIIALLGLAVVLFVVGLLVQRLRYRRRQREMHMSEERYLQALVSSTDGLWDWDLLADTIIYSEGFMGTLGVAPEEFPRNIKSLRSRIHPEDADVVWKAIQRHLRERVPFIVECRLRTQSDTYLWFLTRGQAVWNAAGQAVRMSGWIQDISERKQAELNHKSALSEIKQLKDKLEAERAYLQEEIKSTYNHEKIIGQSDEINYVFYKIEQIATTDTTVLILGETGTGKELVARAIHSLGLRQDRALVKINCAALPANLIESELFGHEKGAFTGAQGRQLGRFEVAHEATLFLDEIGDLPIELQPKLLRVIQDGEFERLGSSRTIRVDTRVIAATNRHLEEEVRQGRFREDLWYRLNIFPITVPPLRDRRQDIPLLVEYFVENIAKRLGKRIETIPASVMDALLNYHWPGNIRELENVLERAVINSSSPRLRLVDELKKPNKAMIDTHRTLADVEREYILQVLEQTRWKVSGKNSASEVLGLDRSTLRARMRKLGITKP